MQLSFSLGVVIFYLGLAALLWELCIEPELLKRAAWFQVAGIGIVLILFDGFTIGIVGARAPATFVAYAMRKGNYPTGTVIGGISWDSHFTDLRVVITNPTNDDYENLDIEIQPDKWIYKAALLNSTGCDLSPIGSFASVALQPKGGTTNFTATRVGAGIDVHDSAGDVFAPLATPSGYRLRCAKLSAQFTVQIVFAVVQPRLDLLKHIAPAPGELAAGKFWLGVEEVAGVNSLFDLLDTRPSPSVVAIKGKYTKGVKPYSIAKSINVGNGN